jgi:succinate dehydrogenase / fumarate reductase, cytochrome b subunit
MFVSILHRATGDGLAIGGALTLLTWLGCAAAGGATYEGFIGFIRAWYGQVLLIALSWGFFQHAASGLRHLLLDTGAGYALGPNRLWAIIVSCTGTILTAMLWLFIWYGRL